MIKSRPTRKSRANYSERKAMRVKSEKLLEEIHELEKDTENYKTTSTKVIQYNNLIKKLKGINDEPLTSIEIMK